MKERPILFSAPMVRAILDGRKTQTRRIVKTCKQFTQWNGVRGPADAYDVMMAEDQSGAHFLVAGDHGYIDLVPCPYGQPGDRLWVKETFAPTVNVNDIEDWPGCPHLHVSEIPNEALKGYKYGFDAIVYKATAPDGWEWLDEDGGLTTQSYWKPSIFMPRWASRITLEITGIRVERLQDITEEDAKAEGVEPHPPSIVDDRVYRRPYNCLWDQINGPDSWAQNPWVWVIEFKRV